MNKKISLGAAIAFTVIVAAITLSITWVVATNSFENLVSNLNERQNIYKKISEIDKYVRNSYIGDIDEQNLDDAIAKGYISGIGDKYGMYYNAEELKKRTLTMEGTLVGIGVTCSLDESGYIKIQRVYDDSPAKAAGFQVNDLIVKIGDTDIQSMGLEQAARMLQGEAGTSVKITMRRNGEDTEKELVRKKVEMPSVDYEMIESNGYIIIHNFDDATPNQFNNAVDDLIKRGAEGLIFDVRNNPGGTLDSVIKILDKLLPEGVIATATYKDGHTEVLGESDDSEIDLPMMVITNQNTASAAELFTIAIRDYEKGKVVGATTYGKGVMQNLHKLSDGTAVNLTIAHYNPPKSENFDGKGITPDFEVKLTDEQEKLFAMLSLEKSKDPQLIKALETINSSK